MARLEDLTRGAFVKGILPNETVTVVDVKWHGSSCIELTYKDSSGRVDHDLLYRDQEPRLEIEAAGRPWSFDGDGALLRLVSEAKRIGLAHLFDPLLAVHTSVLEPLPHQITGVYGEMLPRQPLRFLLADDPGAGKTIMAGLLIKELMVRGDVHRCLICCPGSLVEQWQDELGGRFQLDFDIISRDSFEQSRTGNPYRDKNFVISRLDQMSRNEDIQDKLRQVDWDMVVCDEAHKMSAHYYGNEVKTTKRYNLGKLLGAPERTRHFLLLTATPHNGKETDFQLFLALLDGDRFEGKFRDGVHTIDPSDLMRRLVKEDLLKFDGTPLFPERRAYTINYQLSDLEARLYSEVTAYVREEMNRADRLAKEGEGRRGNLVGFALTILQRRLASSPEAIYRSLERRVERLEKRLREEKLQKRGAEVKLDTTADLPSFDPEDVEDFEDAPSEEVEEKEEHVVDLASAARTIAELEAEINTLTGLVQLAKQVRYSGTDKKWEELSGLLQNNPEMFDIHGQRRKLIIFSEHRDTVKYLTDRIRGLVGKPESVVTIHGSLGREERRKTQQAFTQDKEVQILVATDAAGEGINLQRAHLMINYDLPWNPNRIEQRFGRIHRIGQTEVCHLWNLVASETREGDVYHRLLKKIEAEREALGGKVFDVLGRLFQERSLRDLLIEAIRYGDSKDVREKLHKEVDEHLDREALLKLIEEEALTHDTMGAEQVEKIREDMDRAEARRLQPHFIASFFLKAFRTLGGKIHEREPRRYEITHVPAVVRTRDRQIGSGKPLLQKYERVTFHKELITVEGKPLAEFVCPGHALLDVTTDIMLEQHRDLLRRGAVLVDPADTGEDVRALFYLDHAIQDARVLPNGSRRVVSQQMQFVEIDGAGNVRNAGYAPYLDYKPITPEKREAVTKALEAQWLHEDLEGKVVSYASENIVPSHLAEIRRRREQHIEKTINAVKERLTREINYWDHRAEELKAKELAGKRPRLNSAKARERADTLEARLQKRMHDLELERRLSPRPPAVIGGALVVPQGLLDRLEGKRTDAPDTFARDRARVEQLAMEAVTEAERGLGREPRDVSAEKLGYDIESRSPSDGRLLFIEVKGREADASTVTVTKNEILTALNKPDEFVLAVVRVDKDKAQRPAYLWKPFESEPDFAVTSVTYDLDKLLAKAEAPR